MPSSNPFRFKAPCQPREGGTSYRDRLVFDVDTGAPEFAPGAALLVPPKGAEKSGSAPLLAIVPVRIFRATSSA